MSDSDTNRPTVQGVALQIRDEALAELQEYGRWERGWDGYHGESFDPGVIAVASGLVCRVAESLGPRGGYDIIPGPASDGSVDVEVVSSDRSRRLIVTLYRNEDPRVWLHTRDGILDMSVSAAELDASIDEFLEE